MDMDVRSWWKLVCAAGCLFIGMWGTAQAQEVIRCGSVDGGYANCPTPWRGANLVKKESRSSCRQGRDWGFEYGEIWVDNGCRGLFQQADRGGYGYSRPSRPFGSDFGWHVESPHVSQGSNWAPRPQFGGGSSRPSRYPSSRLVQCGSINKAYNFCPAGIYDGQHVVLETNQSDKRCKWQRDWGVKDGGIWVSNGCRALFSIR